MSELIDRQALKDYVSSLSTHPLNEWDTWGVLAAIDKQPTIHVTRWHRVEKPPKSGQECFTAYRSILRSDHEWMYDICYYTDDLARDCPLMDGAEHRPGWYRYESEYGDVECHPKYWMPIEPPKEDNDG